MQPVIGPVMLVGQTLEENDEQLLMRYLDRSDCTYIW
jgi:hypothetical protein